MQTPDHLSRKFFTDVSDLMVAATSPKFIRLAQEGRQYKIKFTTDPRQIATVAFEGQPRDSKYVTFHFGEEETLVLSFDYIPNGVVKVIDYKRVDSVAPQLPRTILRLLKKGLTMIAQEP